MNFEIGNPVKESKPGFRPKLRFYGPVSVLTVTNRPAFWPFLRRQLAKQRFVPDLQHVVVATFAPPPDTFEGTIWEVVPDGTPIGTMRNAALAKAEGDYGTFVDDDDWQHPEKIADLATLIYETERPVTGFGVRGWFMNLWRRKVGHFAGADVLFANAIFKIDNVRSIPFDDRRRASDTRWMQRLEQHFGPLRGQASIEPPAIWIQHGQNTTDRSAVDYRTDPADLFMDDVTWTIEDDYALDELERRLRR